MAYLHCHTKGCGWSQDDFYSKSYNPLTKLLSDVKWLWKPEIIKIDLDIALDLINYTHVPVFTFKHNYNEANIFSLNWLLLEIVKDIKLAFKMKWWTFKSFKKDKDKGKARCPKCGSQNMFDID